MTQTIYKLPEPCHCSEIQYGYTYEQVQGIIHAEVLKEREACAQQCREQSILSDGAASSAKRAKDVLAYRNAAIGSRFCLERITSRGSP